MELQFAQIVKCTQEKGELGETALEQIAKDTIDSQLHPTWY